ncbi:MAG: ATP-binding protein [Candidatus Binatia bacterium]
MNAIREPVGHVAIREMLRGLAAARAAGAGSALHHAWLFAGPAGVGKFQVARWWASLLKCPEAGACGGSCESCRLMAGAVHPDVFETGPAPKDKNAVQTADEVIERKKSVGIEQSRTLLQRLAMRPTRPGPRVAIVREAGTMTPEAQNALLKILEEPPGSAVIILVTDNIGAMLTTVRSRCRHLAFGALSDEEVSRVLVDNGWSEDIASAAAACARGSASRALEFDPDGLAERESLLLAWEALRREPAGVEALAQALVARKESGYALADLLQWQLARIETSLGRGGQEPSPSLARILEQTGADDTRRLLDEATRIQEAIDMISRNANAKLVIRDLLMNVRA